MAFWGNKAEALATACTSLPAAHGQVADAVRRAGRRTDQLIEGTLNKLNAERGARVAGISHHKVVRVANIPTSDRRHYALSVLLQCIPPDHIGRVGK